jgi:hypothetical protein
MRKYRLQSAPTTGLAPRLNNVATHWGLNASSRFAGAGRDPTRPMRLTCTHGAASTSLSLASAKDK